MRGRGWGLGACMKDDMLLKNVTFLLNEYVFWLKKITKIVAQNRSFI
jgi:hypothetical protein